MVLSCMTKEAHASDILWQQASDAQAVKTLQRAPVAFLQAEDMKVESIRNRGVQPDSNTQVWACLSRLVDYRDGSHLCNTAIAAQVAVIVVAGFETTAHTITWALFELAANQHLQVSFGFLPCPSPALPLPTWSQCIRFLPTLVCTT